VTRTLYVGRNNGLRDRLEASTDGGRTYSPIDLSADTITSLRLVIYDSDPSAPILDRDAKGGEAAEFDLSDGASGVVEWQPGSGVITSEMAGNGLSGHTYHCRWIIVDSASWPQGLVIDAENVQVKP